MKFYDAFELLRKNKAISIKSLKARAFKQELRHLSHWLFEHKDRETIFKEFINAKDWKIDEKIFR